MEITVFKARRLGSAIDARLKDIFYLDGDRFYRPRQNADTAHFVYEILADATDNGDSIQNAKIKEYERLLKLKFSLRRLVGVFNSQTSIDALQSQSRELISLNACLKSFDIERSKPSFSSSNNRFTSGCSDEFLESLKKRVRMNEIKIQNIADDCSKINLTSVIELSEEIVDALKFYDLLG